MPGRRSTICCALPRPRTRRCHATSASIASSGRKRAASLPRPHLRCCAAGPHSPLRQAPRCRMRCWSRPCFACSASPAARSKAWPTRTWCAGSARRRPTHCPTRCAPTCPTGYGNCSARWMGGSGRVYAMEVLAKRLAALAQSAARAQINNIHSIALSGDNDARAKRLAGKLERVLVDAPCSGFGTLRRNPDLKWRHASGAIDELAQKQRAILQAASRLVKPGGRLVYATCSVLRAENEAIAEGFQAAQPEFQTLSCAELLGAQKIALQAGERLRLWPHLQATDGFFAAAFERAS